MMDGKLSADAGALTGGAVDDQTGADAFGALAHARHAEGGADARGGGIEAHAVVDRGDAKAVWTEIQMDLGSRGVGVLDDVVQALLNNAEGRVFNRRRQAAGGTRYL